MVWGLGKSNDAAPAEAPISADEWSSYDLPADMLDANEQAAKIVQGYAALDEGGMALGDDAIDDIELNEEDMNDPELLAQLRACGWEDDDGEPHTEAAPEAAPLKEKAKEKEAAVVKEEAVDESSAPAAVESAPAERVETRAVQRAAAAAASSVDEQLRALKLQAVQLKKEGRKAEALGAMRQIKELQARCEPTSAAPRAASAPPVSVSGRFWTRMHEYKKSAVAWKTHGDMHVAKAHLATYKEMDAKYKTLALGGKVTAADIPPAPQLPPAVVAAAAPAAAAAVPAPRAAASPQRTPVAVAAVAAVAPAAPSTPQKTPEQALVSWLLQVMQTQSQKMAEDAQAAQDAGDTGAARVLLELRKAISQQYDHLRPFDVMDLRGHAPLRYHSVKKSVQVERKHSDLQPNELELSVLSGADLPWSNTHVEFSMPFPSLSKPTTGQTGAGKGKNPEYGFVQRIQVGKRMAERLQTRRATRVHFDMVQHRMFGRVATVASCDVNVKELLRVCELRKLVPLMDNNTATGGTLDVRFRVHRPFGGRDVTTHEYEIFIVDAYPTVAAAVTPPPPPAAAPAPVRAPAAAAASTSAHEGDDDWIDVDNVDSIDSVVSEAVLEGELNKVNEQIQLISAKGGVAPQALLDRKMEIELKSRVWEAEVQAGLLTEDVYVQRVRACIDAHKRDALKLKRDSHIKQAVVLLRRVKVMQEELAEITDEA